MTGPKGPKVLKVLRFDSPVGAEGCGGGWRRKIKRGAPDGAGCIEGLCSLRSRGLSGLRLLRVVVSPSAMNMKSALRDSFSPPSQPSQPFYTTLSPRESAGLSPCPPKAGAPSCFRECRPSDVRRLPADWHLPALESLSASTEILRYSSG